MSSDTADWIVSDLSLEYIKVQVQAVVNGVNPYNPTSDVVQFAFVARETDPGTSDWVSGSWETETVVSPNGNTTQYRALCLIGPGGTKTLVIGLYDVYVKIFDSPEHPVRGPFLLEVAR